jgi:hypothetical protein
VLAFSRIAWPVRQGNCECRFLITCEGQNTRLRAEASAHNNGALGNTKCHNHRVLRLREEVLHCLVQIPLVHTTSILPTCCHLFSPLPSLSLSLSPFALPTPIKLPRTYLDRLLHALRGHLQESATTSPSFAMAPQLTTSLLHSLPIPPSPSPCLALPSLP